ncbi:MAG: MFS transporter [Egibacteraceae bacterium]
MTTGAWRRPRLAADGIWRDRSFLLLFGGYTVSAAGTAITRVVLPILVFQLTGSALQTSTLLILQLVPNMTVGLLAGAVADRVNRRVLMVGADLVNAAALAAIPVLSAAGSLTVAMIYTVALVSATAYCFGNAAEMGALPAIVGKSRLLTASSAMTASYEIMFVVASALGGVLATTIGAAPAIWVDVATYLASALALARIPRAFRTGATSPTDGPLVRGLVRDIAEGMRFVWRHQLIRTLTVIGFGNSFTAGAVLGLLVVYAARQLGLPDDDARIGVLFSAGWAGALAGAILLPRLARPLGAARLSLVAVSVNVPLVCALAVSGEFLASLVVLFAWQVTWLVAISNGRVIRQRLTPDRLQSRVHTVVLIFAWGGQPFGAALGGLLADARDVRTALLAATAGVAMSATVGWLSPLRQITDDQIQALADAADREVVTAPSTRTAEEV